MYDGTSMYQSKKKISSQNRQWLETDVNRFLDKKKQIYCKALKRKVSLEKLPAAITERRDAKRRLQRLYVAIDILQYAKEYTVKKIDKKQCYELRGHSVDDQEVIVHVREEVQNKNKVLFFVSCF